MFHVQGCHNQMVGLGSGSDEEVHVGDGVASFHGSGLQVSEHGDDLAIDRQHLETATQQAVVCFPQSGGAFQAYSEQDLALAQGRDGRLVVAEGGPSRDNGRMR